MFPSRPLPCAAALAMLVLAACAPSSDAPGPDTTRGTAPPASAGATVEATPTAATQPGPRDMLDAYGVDASALAAALAAGGEVAPLVSQAEALMDRGAAIVPAFVEKHPHCAPYLEAALRVREAWPSLDHDTIERDYHHDGALPKIENAGFCYHMKDLVTHPATALVLLSTPTPDPAGAKAEIDEVIAHLGIVRGQL